MILEVRNLKVYFPVYGGKVFQKKVGDIKAVDGVDLQISEGEIFGLVGESGCGKTTLAKAILGMVSKTSGEIIFSGYDLDALAAASRKETARRIQYISQDPFLSLNPMMRIGDIIAEGIDIHKLARDRKEREEKVVNLMKQVGLDSDSRYRYPIEFSAGQRQRVAIARALAVKPSFLVCDEPVSSLDVSVQDQILRQLISLKKTFGLTVLFITHDLAVIDMISDKTAVMYLGKIVERAENRELFQNPLHPYTRILFSSVPKQDPVKARAYSKERISGEVPSARDIPSGCRFHTRCPVAKETCTETEPELNDFGGGHFAACHKANK